MRPLLLAAVCFFLCSASAQAAQVVDSQTGLIFTSAAHTLTVQAGPSTDAYTRNTLEGKDYQVTCIDDFLTFMQFTGIFTTPLQPNFTMQVQRVTTPWPADADSLQIVFSQDISNTDMCVLESLIREGAENATFTATVYFDQNVEAEVRRRTEETTRLADEIVAELNLRLVAGFVVVSKQENKGRIPSNIRKLFSSIQKGLRKNNIEIELRYAKRQRNVKKAGVIYIVDMGITSTDYKLATIDVNGSLQTLRGIRNREPVHKIVRPK